MGNYADWCQLYVRTDPAAPKHKGISCLLVDMKTPGISVRPLRTMAGDYLFSELFFDEVRVPRSALLGNLNEGWRVAVTTLSHERAGVARLYLGLSTQFDELLAAAHRRGPITDPLHRDRLARLYASIACIRYSTARELAKIEQGGQPSATMGGLAKLSWARATQEIGRAGHEHPGSRCARWGRGRRTSPCLPRRPSPAGPATSIATSWENTDWDCRDDRFQADLCLYLAVPSGKIEERMGPNEGRDREPKKIRTERERST